MYGLLNDPKRKTCKTRIDYITTAYINNSKVVTGTGMKPGVKKVQKSKENKLNGGRNDDWQHGSPWSFRLWWHIRIKIVS